MRLNKFYLLAPSRTTLTNEKRRIAVIIKTIPIKIVLAAINVRLVFNLPISA